LVPHKGSILLVWCPDGDYQVDQFLAATKRQIVGGSA